MRVVEFMRATRRTHFYDPFFVFLCLVHAQAIAVPSLGLGFIGPFRG